MSELIVLNTDELCDRGGVLPLRLTNIITQEQYTALRTAQDVYIGRVITGSCAITIGITAAVNNLWVLLVCPLAAGFVMKYTERVVLQRLDCEILSPCEAPRLPQSFNFILLFQRIGQT